MRRNQISNQKEHNIRRGSQILEHIGHCRIYNNMNLQENRNKTHTSTCPNSHTQGRINRPIL